METTEVVQWEKLVSLRAARSEQQILVAVMYSLREENGCQIYELQGRRQLQ